MKVAIFDFDGTLLCGNSWQLLFWWMLRRHPGRTPGLLVGLVLRRLRLMSARQLKERLLSGLRGLNEKEVGKFGKDFFGQVLAPRLCPAGLREIESCRESGCEIVLITGAFDFVVQPLVDAQKILHWRATCLEYEQGCCTGRILGPELVGEEKPAAVRAMFSGREVDWAGSRAYGDEPADLPVLSLVGRPCYIRSGPPVPATLPPGCSVVEWEN
jgi:HAD superfamily hydrolase (TIGR01490 family)